MNAARREAHGGTPAPETEVNEEDGMAKKLIMLSLEALLTEFREQKVAIVWVAPVTTPEWYRQDPGLPRLTSRVLVTATALERAAGSSSGATGSGARWRRSVRVASGRRRGFAARPTRC
jgi:hypothetical protein